MSQVYLWTLQQARVCQRPDSRESNGNRGGGSGGISGSGDNGIDGGRGIIS